MIGWIVAAFVAGGMFGVVVMALAAASGEGTEKSDVPRAIAGRESVQISEDFTGRDNHIQRVLQREWTDDVPVQKPGDGTVDGLRLFRVQDCGDGPEERSAHCGGFQQKDTDTRDGFGHGDFRVYRSVSARKRTRITCVCCCLTPHRWTGTNTTTGHKG
jgi:hypothetical protein